MQRAQNSELVKRINSAFTMLQKEKSQPQIVELLVEKYGISQVQAYRYLQLARAINEKITVPESSVVFTVKLPPTLIKRVKKLSKSKRLSISKVVYTALEDFLAKKDHAQKGETS
jgi:hypothetical protein